MLVERRTPDPMFRLSLFRIRAFTFGTLSTFLSAVARGGLMFMLIIWLQGIWLPQHGYDFTETPLWAGIYMVPLTIGMLLRRADLGLSVRPLRRAAVRDRRDGAHRDRLRACSCCCRPTSPTRRSAAILLLIGVAMGMFASPNRAAVMNSLPREDRGAGGAMNQTFQNSAQVLSIGIFFTLMIVGLAATLPETMSAGLQAHGVPPATAHHVAHAAAGVDPVRRVPRLQPDPAPRSARTCSPALSAHDQAVLTGGSFFPTLISGPFRDGLHAAFLFAIVACLIAAAASLLRGGRMIHDDAPEPAAARPPPSAHRRTREATCRLT